MLRQRLLNAAGEEGSGASGDSSKKDQGKTPDLATLFANQQKLGSSIELILGELKSLKEAKPPEPKADDKDSKDGKSGKDGEDLSPKEKAEVLELRRNQAKLEKQLETLRTENETSRQNAEKATRESEVTRLLSGYQFTKASAQETVRTALLGKISRSSVDNSLVIDGTPLESAVASLMESTYDFALKPNGQGGTGAQPGQLGGKAPSLEVTPGMDADARAKVARDIAAQMVGTVVNG